MSGSVTFFRGVSRIAGILAVLGGVFWLGSSGGAFLGGGRPEARRDRERRAFGGEPRRTRDKEPADLPDLGEAKLRMEMTHGRPSQLSIFRVDVPADRVGAYVQERFQARGWTPGSPEIGRSTPDRDGAIALYTKGRRQCLVSFAPADGSAGPFEVMVLCDR